MAPFFSIIVPVYNRASLVGETIDTVMAQTFQSFELILIDDKSTDNSLEVITAYAEKDKRIKIIALPENQGRCGARNAGLAKAKGQWFCYLDSDDFYAPHHLETMHNLIQEFPRQKAFATEQTFGEKPKEYNQVKFKQDLVELGIEDFIESNPISANQLCYHNTIDLLWSEENIPISEDWLFHRLLSLQTSILKKKTVTTDVRLHEERSINVSSIDNFVYWNLYAANKFIELNKEDTPPVNDRVHSYITILCANIYLKNGLKWKGFKLLMQSLLSLHAYKNSLLYKGFVKIFIPSKILAK